MPPAVSIFWNDIFINPMLNSTVVLYRVFFNNYGLAIIVFTLLMRLITLPLTIRQVRSSRKMTLLQPRLSEIQKKYKDPKRRSEETMKIYKEEGINPAGCVFPMLVQFPVWIALYTVIRLALGVTPESLIDLSSRLYPWGLIQSAVPIASHFLIWDMSQPDNKRYVLPVLVAASMWFQQKLTMTQASMANANQSQAQTNQTLLYMMPLMFGWFTLTVPAGLALYWLVSNVVGVVMNYYVFGWQGTSWKSILLTSGPATPARDAGSGNNRNALGIRPESGRADLADASASDQTTVRQASGSEVHSERAGSSARPELVEGPQEEKKSTDGRDGRGGSKRKNGRRGNQQGTQATRPGAQPGRGRSP